MTCLKLSHQKRQLRNTGRPPICMCKYRTMSTCDKCGTLGTGGKGRKGGESLRGPTFFRDPCMGPWLHLSLEGPSVEATIHLSCLEGIERSAHSLKYVSESSKSHMQQLDIVQSFRIMLFALQTEGLNSLHGAMSSCSQSTTWSAPSCA